VRNARLPCDAPNTSVPAAGLGISTDGTVFLACTVGDPAVASGYGPGQAYLSRDQGRTWSRTSAPPEPYSAVAAVRGRMFAWAKDLSVQDGHGWRLSLAGPPSGKGFVLVGFEDDAHGLALGSDGVLHLTGDAGRTWRDATF
jgi:photosystem II stability/assembly factor-like uncharacterized protein